jgi:rhamnulose-1-phosphate aldolase/alcohol dehydrogenase
MQNLWRDEEAAALSGLELLVYRSRLIGRDPNLVVWGGGNTSIKHEETDFRGRRVRVMRIKGSGSDLKTIVAKHFPGIRLDALMEPQSPRPSIETLLHGFVPHPHIDHTHADAILALTNTADGRRQVEAVYGQDAVWVPYRRPGFTLSREVAEAIKASPKARCVVLEKHGLITWGRSAKESYDATIEMNTRAEEHARQRAAGKAVFGPVARAVLPREARRAVVARIAPRLRGLLSGRPPGAARAILRFDDGDDVLEFVSSKSARELCLAGPATPDHLLYTKPRPLFVEPPGDLEAPGGAEGLKAALAEGLRQYAAWYEEYVRKHGTGKEPRLDPIPRVVLIPGVGMLTAWKDAKHTRIVADIYHHTIGVMRAAQGIGEYRSLDIKDTFDVEYWPMELYKLTLAPPEKELARRVALVTGAAHGIGRAVARLFAAEGCHVAVTDLDGEKAAAVAREICDAQGMDRAIGLRMDVADEASVEAAFRETVVAYGGVDLVVSNAGMAHSAPLDKMELKDWQRSLDVNATGHFLVGRAALRILKDQMIGGGLVFVASKNVPAPGKDFGAYSAAKAAETQLARVLAIEAGEHGIRVNIVNPDAVFQDSHLWSEAVRQERARAHGVLPDQLEDFYRKRNLLKVRVLAEDVAQAALWLASDRSGKTTGCMLPVDGGVREAFPR